MFGGFNSIANYGLNVKPITLQDLTGGTIRLSPGVYNLVYNIFAKEYEVNKTSDYFKLPKKMYGKANQYASHFLEAYKKSDNNLGVLLTGEKGTGKTELAKLLANMGIKEGYPVITIYDIGRREINKLIEFIESLGDAVIFFDEFGKNFPIREQDKLLTLLSSSNTGKKLYIITENSYYNISNFIRSRPGRARYHLDFQRLEADTVKEYLDENVSDREFKDKILNFYNKSTRFTFDYLKAIVEEHKLFPEHTFEEIIQYLNIDELKKTIFLEVVKVFKTDKDNKKIEVQFLQINEVELSDFKLARGIRLEIFNIVKDKENIPKRELLDVVVITKDDIEKIEDNRYYFRKVTKGRIYYIEAEEMDELTKRKIEEEKMLDTTEEIPMPDINQSIGQKAASPVEIVGRFINEL